LFRHADYQALCARLPGLVLLGVPAFGPKDGDALRRLIWLIDAAWEALLPLAVTAEVALDMLFEGIGGGLDQLLGKDLQRTRSRLVALLARQGKLA
jgi:cell division protein ZapE